ncbi:MAG: 6-bladed beta-propeller [Gammaproteobacteria bacterium]|nr:6-bladed beta-propeller [Gammaproteobacteria bacterium]
MGTAAKRLVALMLSGILISSCVTSDVVGPFEGKGRVWPAAPELARIEFVREFSNLSDLGIRPSLWSQVLTFAAGPDRDSMVRPMAVAATNDGGVIFVADPDANCIHRYDLERRRYRCLVTGEGEPDISAVGLAVTEYGEVFATDSQQGRLWRAGPKDKTLKPYLVSEALDQPTGIFWSSEAQRLFVTDTGRQAVLEFDRLGNLQRVIGERGNRPGQLNYPTYLWGDSGHDLLVTDSLNFRVQRFDRDAKFLHTFGENGDQPGDFSRPKGIATDSHGHVYVIDALMHMLQIFDGKGELLLAIGEQGQGEGQFWLPNGIFITRDNKIFVADSYNKRVQVFRYVGPES